MNESRQIASTILEQLGGKMFQVMVGAKYLETTGTGLRFRIGGGAQQKITTVEVNLDPSDTYTVTFGKMFKGEHRVVSQHNDIYCDMLQELFTQETGFYTHF